MTMQFLEQNECFSKLLTDENANVIVLLLKSEGFMTGTFFFLIFQMNNNILLQNFCFFFHFIL